MQLTRKMVTSKVFVITFILLMLAFFSAVAASRTRADGSDCQDPVCESGSADHCGEETADTDTCEDFSDQEPCCPDSCDHCAQPCCGGHSVALIMSGDLMLFANAGFLPAHARSHFVSIHSEGIFHPPRV